MKCTEAVTAHIGEEQLEIVEEYLGATMSDDANYVQEIIIRIAVAISSLAKFKPIWRGENILMESWLRFLEH